jgi:putative beta-barrel porin BBP2
MNHSYGGLCLKFVRGLGVLALTTSAFASTAAAQGTGVDEGGPDPQTVRVRLGPLWMNPRIELKNMGVDTNVFNEPEDANPKRDFTFTLTPTTDAWIRVGRSWFKFTIAEDLVWFQKYTDQRSANEHDELSWRLPLNRIAVTLSPTYLRTNDRPGFEIDARVRHTEWGGQGQVDVRAFPKTSFGVTGRYKKVSFDDSAVFLGANLGEQLNRTESAAGFAITHQLTPLTKIAFNAEQERDRFADSPLRDADSTRGAVSVSFDPHALLKGGATIGIRDFRPIDSSLGGYTGLVAVGDLSYTLLDSTRFQVQFRRDVQYSYDINQPYYLETGVNGSIAQQIFGPIDAIARAGTAKLAYRDRVGAAVAVSNRVDYNHTYGGGVGYHFSDGMRVGFNIDYYNRITDVTERRYNGLRYGATATYDF